MQPSLRCIMSENKVTVFDWLMASEAGSTNCGISRLPIFELRKAPTAGRSIFFGVLDHELDVGGCPGYKRLVTAKDLIVLVRDSVDPSQAGNDRAIRKWALSIAIGLDCHIIAEDRTEIVEIASFVRYGNQLPVTVSGWNFDSEDRVGLFHGSL